MAEKFELIVLHLHYIHIVSILDQGNDAKPLIKISIQEIILQKSQPHWAQCARCVFKQSQNGAQNVVSRSVKYSNEGKQDRKRQCHDCATKLTNIVEGLRQRRWTDYDEWRLATHGFPEKLV